MINPTTGQAKTMAKRLRTALAAGGTMISHSEALELVAREHGVRDWNTFVASAPPDDQLVQAVPIIRIFDAARSSCT